MTDHDKPQSDQTNPPTDQANPGTPDGEAPPPANDSTPADAAAQVAALADEIAQLKDKLLRAMAETENVRRRSEREREDTAKYALSNFAKELATVADNLRRAIDAVAPEARAADPALKALAEGVEVTERAMLAAFERFGVKRVDPLGQRFDPNRHQAMAQVEADQPAGIVVQVMQPGYVIHERLLRPAMVIVSKGKPGGEASAAQSGVDIKA
jgi:molecular chaperone GrpE